MYKDYIRSIVETYKRLKVENELSDRLASPTPAGIKEECQDACNNRYDRRDDKILRTFFGRGGDKKIVAQAIEQCSIDKFRPLVNFLEQKTKKTKHKNIELLAWLIDFKQRPYDYEKGFPSLDKNLKAEALSEGKEKREIKDREINNNEGINESDTRQRTKYGKSYSEIFKKVAIIVGIVLLLVGVPTYWIWRDKFFPASKGYEACMYWNGDHYEQISCNQKRPGTLIIALDTNRLNSFKLITRPDTITFWSVGKVWYSKRNNKLEFYTSGGSHPMDQQVTLRPISVHIIKTYLHPDN
jgi:hypothetical protein